MTHNDPPARRSFAHWARLHEEAKADARRLAELACWVEWRCPELWRQAGDAIARRLPIAPSWSTQRGGQFIEALRLAGVMDPERAAEAMRPYAELEAARVAWRGNAPALGVHSHRLTDKYGRLSENTTSDDQASRFGGLRARRAGFLAARSGGRQRLTSGAHGSSTGDLGAPEPAPTSDSSAPARQAGRAGAAAHAG